MLNIAISPTDCNITPTRGRVAISMTKSQDLACLKLGIIGVFSLKNVNGKEISIRDLRARAMIVILARSHGMVRARTWLQAMLWDTVGKDQSANLRVLLHRLRKDLEPYGDHVIITNDSVRLNNISEAEISKRQVQSEFFEDAGYISEGFEDWLRIERTQYDTAKSQLIDHPAIEISSSFGIVRPKVTISARATVAIDTWAAVAVDWLKTFISEQLFASGLVEVANVEISDSNNSKIDLMVEIGAVQGAKEINFDITAIPPNSGIIIWNSSYSVNNNIVVEANRELIAQFVNQTASMIERFSFRNFRCDEAPNLPTYSFVKNLITLSRDQVTETVAEFENVFNNQSFQPSAKDYAWLAFGYMILAGEALSSDRDSAQERARKLLDQAFELDPTDSVSLSIAGQFAAYVGRDFQLAQEFLEDGLKLAPYSPLLLDTLAMHKLYIGDIEAGSLLAEKALLHGKYGPLKHYFEASRVIAASLSGEHAKAVELGMRLLCERPNFLPVLRHVSASLADLGRVNDALKLIQFTRNLDGGFGTDALYDQLYPLPSDASREFIIKALKKKNLFN